MIIFLLAHLFIASNYAFAEGEPWAQFRSISFENKRVGMKVKEFASLNDEGRSVFYLLDPISWKTTEMSQKEFDSNFAAHAQNNDAPSLKWGIAPESYGAGKDEIKIKNKKSRMDDPDNECSTSFQAEVHGNKITLDTEECMKVVTAEIFSDQLWLGFAQLGEYEWYGRGIQIYNIKSMELISDGENIATKGELASLIKKDPLREWTWVASDKGVTAYDRNLKIVRHCQLKVPTSNEKLVFRFDCVSVREIPEL